MSWLTVLTPFLQLVFFVLDECCMCFEAGGGCQYGGMDGARWGGGDLPFEAPIDLTVGTGVRPDGEVLRHDQWKHVSGRAAYQTWHRCWNSIIAASS